MSPYKYADLDEKEIRLLTLLPSCNFDDPIQITIAHVPFAFGATWGSNSKKSPLEAIRETLPKDREIGDTLGWDAGETLEGRILYSYWDDKRDDFVSTWTHPTLDESDVPHNSYDLGDRVAFQPAYEALSYTWGSAINPETAYVERQETTNDHTFSQTTLGLAQNLAAALRHFRYLGKPRILWADAICINQQNNPERNQQVQRMREIYKYADRVVVWLGLSSENSALALSTLEHIGKQVETTRDYTLLPSPDCTEPQLLSTIGLPFDEGVWQAIIYILERPWFERVWTVQEIQLGSSTSTIQCGEYQISWYLLRRAINRLYMGGTPRNVFAKVHHIVYLAMNMRGDPLPTLLQYCDKLKCSDPLDKVYGMLGLAPPLVASKIHPSYELLAPEAYKTAFLSHIDAAQRLELLDHYHTHSGLVQSPSWVPDWSVARNTFTIIDLTLVSSGCSSAHYKYTAPNTLEVLGVQCFKIQAVVQPRVGCSEEVSGSQGVPQGVPGWGKGPDSQEVEGAEQPSGRLGGTAKLQSSVYPTGEPLLDAYADVLNNGMIKDIFDDQTGPVGFPTLQDAKESLLNKLSKYSELNYDPIDIPTLLKSNETFILTEEGYFGKASEGVRQDDYICTILGSQLPKILRKVPGNSSFQVIGSCFVHGLMNGEALLGPLPPPWTVWRVNGSRGICRVGLFNKKTKKKVSIEDDPRLGEMPPEWERLEVIPSPDDPYYVQRCRNKVTGEEINSDPRLLPEALEKRGVKLQTFRLV